tara:strand:+ start:13330 stop:14337 length:1008 start_codon:yes stop_codon:yes gene_type:complete
MSKKTFVLVTGSDGLVGNGIKIATTYNSFTNDDKNHVFYYAKRSDADLLIPEEVNKLFERVKPDIVVHLAARVGGLFANMRNPVKFFEDNMLMQINIMRASRETKVKRIISCLSTCIFPAKVDYPIRELSLHDGEPHESNFAYSYAKRMVEVLGRAYEKEHNIECINICPCNVYGPYDNFNSMDAHVIPSLIHRCYNCIKNEIDFEVYGTGKPLRQFIYNVDLGKIILKLISKKDLRYKTYIIASPPEQEKSIKDVAELILNNFHNFDFAFKTAVEVKKTKMVWNTNKSDGQYRKTVSIDQLLYEFDDAIEFTDIKIGLKKTVDWFIDNYGTIRK